MFTVLTVTDLPGARKLKRRFHAVLSLQDPHCKGSELLRFTKLLAPQHLRLRFDGIGAECARDWQDIKVRQRTYWMRERPRSVSLRRIIRSITLELSNAVEKASGRPQ